jgi:hypothetical protein
VGALHYRGRVNAEKETSLAEAMRNICSTRGCLAALGSLPLETGIDRASPSTWTAQAPSKPAPRQRALQLPNIPSGIHTIFILSFPSFPSLPFLIHPFLRLAGLQLLLSAQHEVPSAPGERPPIVAPHANQPRRFGQQLKSSLVKDWMYYYIDYEGLKEALRTHRAWDESEEQKFVEKLETELDKVYTFTKVKSDEIIRRIRASEKEVHDVVSRTEDAADSPEEEEFELLEEDLSDIIADVHDLAKFTQLNYTGFQKIIKKHDVGCATLDTCIGADNA